MAAFMLTLYIVHRIYSKFVAMSELCSSFRLPCSFVILQAKTVKEIGAGLGHQYSLLVVRGD